MSEEPVAYMWKTAGGNVLGFQEYKDDIPYPGYATPLYTAEQLHPRVKMTQAEFDEFSDLASYSKLIGVITHLYDEHVEKYPLLFKRFCGDNDTIKLAVLWSLFDPDNPEETIEIVPDMKWFVRSKKVMPNSKYLYLESVEKYVHYAPEYHQSDISYAAKFDTKEEAERWCNPLCESVLLPVEGE